MGNSMCSRRQKKIFQTLFFLTIVFGFLYGLLLYYEMHNQLKKAETLASKYQQHQEALSAQLQVVYEHRSRLEKSLQKERNEHKKAKEDYLVYKLEAQEAINKEKQDSSNRYSALSIQHKMMKSQHEDLRKQYTDLHEEHLRLGEDHNRAMSEHNRRYLSLQQAKEQEISKLKDNIYNLLEENKKLRKAHQDVHVQLQDVRQLHKNLLLQHDQLQVTLEDHKNSLSAAQAQVEEYKQLRETLNKMPSLRQTEQKPPSNVEKRQQDVAEPLQYHNKLGARDQISYRSEGNQHNENNDVQLHAKLLVGEKDATKIREDNEEVEERQYAQHENWQRNNHPAHSDLHKQEYESREHHHEWEQEEKEDPTEDHTELHRQHLEEEETEHHLIHDQDNENYHAEEQDPAEGNPTEIKMKHKSPYEEQLEQQRLAELRAEESRKLKERQDALHEHRLREYMDRQERLQQEAERKEELLREEQLRKQSVFNNEDAVEGDDEQDVHEEEEEDENNPQEEAEDEDPEIENEEQHTEHENINEQLQNSGWHLLLPDMVNFVSVKGMLGDGIARVHCLLVFSKHKSMYDLP
ncbi:Golgi integral membrane protein 4a isoform X2 [Stegostoma tigrinum]|uniref:Golgi integral membrane protein 4a isoform X2 n=1 Tax=Stegostoma tigrinum TaxID=3053191 RepID=UPI0028709DCC|nr:Golgi integral membrane protein 4a isoform X2 [Stegostoma tigrinum]